MATLSWSEIVVSLLLAALLNSNHGASAKNKGPSPCTAPQIYGNGYEDRSKWLVIKSIQETLVYPAGKRDVTGKTPNPDDRWIVEEYHNYNSKISYSRHKQISGSEWYVLVRKNHRSYYIDGSENSGAVCRLDHRQDHSTNFPWLHEPSIVGVAGLWMNMIDFNNKCELQSSPSSKIHCIMVDENAKVEVEMDFADDSSSPKSARVLHHQAIHVKSTNLLQEVETRVVITEMSLIDSLDENQMNKIEIDIKTCEDSVAHTETVFPSLLRELADGKSRAYRFTYKIDTFTGASKTPVKTTKVEEWFSFEKEAQVLDLSSKFHWDKDWTIAKYHKLFKYKQQQATNTDLIMAVTQDKETKKVSCDLVNSIDWPLGSTLGALTNLLTRQVQFPEIDGHPAHSGELLGLGALLMNAAEIRDKVHLGIHDYQNGNSFLKQVSIWLVDDAAAGLRFIFYQRVDTIKDGAKKHFHCDLDDLFKVEILKMVPEKTYFTISDTHFGSLSGDSAADGQLVHFILFMSIDMELIYTHMISNLIDDGFRRPAICPDVKTFPLNTDHKTTGEHINNPIEEWTFKDSDYEFPIFEQILDMEGDFVLKSNWMFADESNMDMIERQRFEFNEARRSSIEFKQLDRNFILFLRDPPDEYFYKVEGSSCIEVGHISGWIEDLRFDQEMETLMGTRIAVLYGLHAIWRMASESPKAQFLGRTQDKEDKVILASWLLYGEDRYEDYIFTFQFNMLPEISMHSLFIEYDGNNASLHQLYPIHVTNIELTLGSKASGPVKPPDFCFDSHTGPSDTEDDVGDIVTNTPDNSHVISDEIPGFKTMFKNLPHLATYEFHYTIIWKGKSGDGTENEVTVIETHQSNSFGLLQIFKDEKLIAKLHLLIYGRVLVEQVSSGNCKELEDINEFMGFNRYIKFLESSGKSDEDVIGSNLLVAEIWNLFNERAKMPNHEFGIEDRTENDLELKSWHISGATERVIITFRLDKSDNQLHLHSLEMKSLEEPDTSFILIQVHETSSKISPSISWQLSPECAHVMSGEVLPVLRDPNSELSDRVELRSELTMSSGDRKSVSQLDEFLLDNLSSVSYRARLSDNQRYRDMLFYEQTREIFDLSKRFTCKSIVNTKTKLKPPSASWLLDNLLGNNIEDFPLGPLALWIHANKLNFQNMLLFEPLDLEGLLEQVSFDKWYATQRWRITHEHDKSLVYELEFSIETEPAYNRLVKHYELTAVHLIESPNKPSGQSITMTVVYTRPYVNMHELRIPIGFGCTRNDDSLFQFGRMTKDVLELDLDRPLEFEYTAHLSLLDEWGNLKPNSNLIVLSGQYAQAIHCPEMPSLGQLVVHRHRASFTGRGGQTVTEVTEARNGASGKLYLSYVSDEGSGMCSIAPIYKSKPTSSIELKFRHEASLNSDGSDSHTVLLSELLLKQINQELDGYSRVQTFNLRNTRNQVWVYEKRVNSLKLSDDIEGTASIVHTLIRTPELRSKGIYDKELIKFKHDTARVDIFVLSKAHLSISFANIRSGDCFVALAAADPESCLESNELISAVDTINYNAPPKVRSFTMVVRPVDDPGNRLFSMIEDEERILKQSLTKELLAYGNELSPMQVGHILVAKDEQDRSFTMEFNLIEPPSPIEYFFLMQNWTVARDPGSGTHIIERLAVSASMCSRRCQDHDQCYAFSYCEKERICRLILLDVAQENDVNEIDTGKRLGVRLRQRAGCSLHYAPDLRRLEPLDTIVQRFKLITGALNSPQSPAMRFELPVGGAGPNLPIKLVAMELIETTMSTSSSEFNEAPNGKLKAEYSILRQGVFLSVQKLDGTIKSLISQVDNSESLGECFQRCTRKSCNLLAFDDKRLLCSTFKGFAHFGELETAIEQMAEISESGSVYLPDHLADYHEFRSTSLPKDCTEMRWDVTVLECAAMCQLGTGNEQQTDCLSFDYCRIPESNRSGCYLQKLHVVMDSFDESVFYELNKLQDQSQLSPDKQLASQFSCSHYSRSLLADFKQNKGTKFVEHPTLVFKGTDLDVCSLICRRDENCPAFEHCLRPGVSPPNTCYILRMSNQDEESKANLTAVTSDPNCSVYQVTRNIEKLRLGGDSETDAEEDNWPEMDKGTRWFVGFILVVGGLVAALALGMTLHMIYIYCTGNYLPFTRSLFIISVPRQ